jgi:RecA/RadA recombinase
MLIPTGLQLLDTILGGGFPVGAMSMIVGEPGSGKSMLAFQTLGNAQIHFNGKLLGNVLDSEFSATQVRLANLGVRNPKVKPHNEITVETVFKYLETVCLFKEKKNIIDIPSLVIWDSIANTLTQKELEAEDPNSVIGYKARLLSLLIPKYAAKCSKYNICMLTVNQLRDNMKLGNIYQQPKKELKFLTGDKNVPGGNVLRFNAFHLLEMSTGKALTEDKFGFTGVAVKVKCVKNKLFPPNIPITLYGSFTSGFSNFWTNYYLLVDNKRLNTGAWNYLVDMPEKKFRTKDAHDHYKDNEEFRDKFDNAVNEVLKEEYINKYQGELQ